MTTTTAAETWSPARIARYERLGAYFDRDRRNLEYLRNKQADGHRARADQRATQRHYARVNRENDAIKARRNELWRRREGLYGARAAMIRSRVIAERKIKPPGKTAPSQRRHHGQVQEAMRDDPECRALSDRYGRATRLMERIRKRRGEEHSAAHVLAIDDRATRHRKRAGWMQLGPR